MKIKIHLPSIENSSLIHKFMVLFVVMSLLPFLVVTYLFILRTSRGVDLSEDALFFLLALTGVGSLIGYYAMRKSIMKIRKVTQDAGKLLSNNIPGLAETLNTNDSEVTQLTQTFSEVTKNLENNIKRLEASKRTMQYVLSKLAVGIASVWTIDTFLDLIVEITTNALDAKCGALMLLDQDKDELYVKAVSGPCSDFVQKRIKVGEEACGWVAKHKKPLFIPQLAKSSDTKANDLFSPPLLCAPMLYQDKLIGVLLVSGRLTGRNFEEDELIIISNLGSQTAVAVENERLNLDAEKTYIETISALAMAVEARDRYSRGHSDRVAQYSVKIAQKLSLADDLVTDIKNAAELHDVGKIGISDDILNKNNVLNEEEQEIMRRHPVIGEGIIKPVRSLSRLCSIIRSHHERLDGSGYPDGLKADEVPIGAKIVSVADTFDAMTTTRPYRKGLTSSEAKAELSKFSGIHYDKKIVDAFLELV